MKPGIPHFAVSTIVTMLFRLYHLRVSLKTDIDNGKKVVQENKSITRYPCRRVETDFVFASSYLE